jgi:hypothetical protein
MGLFLLQGVLCEMVRSGPAFFSTVVWTRGGSGASVYEFAHRRQRFVPRDYKLKGFV